MERFAIKKMLAWKQSSRRKPLILKGVRQVGKTWGSSSKPPSLIDGEANLFKLGAFDRGLKSVESSRER